jgi:rhodanese-related sulfurtransferase
MSVVKQINPAEAFALLKKDPDSVLVDVRTFEEFNFVGVADASEFNNRMILLPWQLMPTMEVNHNFNISLKKELEKLFKEKATKAKVVFLCRTGGRSNQAANQALTLGYENSYNLVNGFEGDLDEFSQRGKINGWKAKLLPWRQK